MGIIHIPIAFNDNDNKGIFLAVRIALQIGLDKNTFENTLFQLNEKQLTYTLERYDFLKDEKERNHQRNHQRNLSTSASSITTIIKPTRFYERLAIVPLQTVFDNLGKTIIVKDNKVSVKSKRYKCYARKGIICVKCGIEGHYFAAERQVSRQQPPTTKYHLNLYHLTKEGKEIMMTVDHCQPLSRGGLDIISNLQPMCIYCNSAKSNMTEEEFKKIPFDPPV